MTVTTDQELVLQIQAGNQRAFNVLYTKYKKYAERMAYRLIRREEVIDEFIFVICLKKRLHKNGFR